MTKPYPPSHTNNCGYSSGFESVQELLEYIERYGDTGSAGKRLIDATNLYLISQHGIGVCGYQSDLPPDYPHRQVLQTFLDEYHRATDLEQMDMVLSRSRSKATELFSTDYPDLSFDSARKTSTDISYR